MNAETFTAADGLIARPLDPWGHEKHFIIERYLGIFCVGMKDSWQSLVYADLFSGPGICVDRETGAESNGTALLGVQRPEISRLFLNDKSDRVAEALRIRTAGQPVGRVKVTSQDCNLIVDDVREFLFPSATAGGTLGLAVIDPTGLQMTFDALNRLTSGVRLDLIITFMTDFVRRFHGVKSFANALDGFLGMTEWRDRGSRVTPASVLDIYENQLRSIGYNFVDHRIGMQASNGHTIYHLVFASKHARGADFFDKISRITYSGQRRLF